METVCASSRLREVAAIKQPNCSARPVDAHVYESPSFVKKERIIRASVNLPFVYPSIGVSLAPVGCFEVALAAPSVNEPKAQ